VDVRANDYIRAVKADSSQIRVCMIVFNCEHVGGDRLMACGIVCWRGTWGCGRHTWWCREEVWTDYYTWRDGGGGNDCVPWLFCFPLCVRGGYITYKLSAEIVEFGSNCVRVKYCVSKVQNYQLECRWSLSGGTSSSIVVICWEVKQWSILWREWMDVCSTACICAYFTR